MDNQWGSLIPIWSWEPIAVYCFALGIDFGAVMAIRRVFEGKAYLGVWWSFKVGDIFGLPVYMAFASVVLKNSHHPDVFYTQLWLQIVLISAGYLIWTLIQINNYRSGQYPKEVIFNPSELYHSVIYGVMFYLVASSLTPLILDHNPTWATLGALLGLGVWFVCVAIDSLPSKDISSERERKAIWQMPWWPWKQKSLA